MDFRRIFDRKGLFGELLGEYMGTLILILFGDGVVGAVILFLGYNSGSSGTNNGLSASASWMLINWGWGFAVTFGVYTASALTGAHINPAVTLAFALRRNFPWVKVIPYFLAQFLGAFSAAVILYVEYSTGFASYEAANHIVRDTPGGLATGVVFFTDQKTAIGGQVVPIQTAFFDEVLGTALLLFLILAVVDLRNTPPAANLAPLIIGLIVVVIGMSFGVDSGYAINPARDFGPRLFAAFVGWGRTALPGVNNYFWVPIVAPLVGGVFGAYIYDFTIHESLEARFIQPTPGLEEEGRSVAEDHRDDQTAAEQNQVRS